MLTIARTDPRSDGARRLLEDSHAMMRALFPPDQNYFLDLEALCAPGIHFFSAAEDSRVLGTAALVERPGYGEVKSMFTDPQARGRGVAGALLRRIEDQARSLDLPCLRLETGTVLTSALRLYEKHGFVARDIFGDYRPNDSSVYMEKPLLVPAPDA
ncbi:GNAT family N-acetyltransferase [Roseovarius sp. TE539]|uniref:GNAT family N-acetyltransferase n=1 Tax=Roseovarius sp. TE539 TaxID=2249812 RepID=UPI000DE14656|nr:GNAT family N-acetyltransferase [Roseovarius sp. TE539]RBI71461.1 GNAT family N-acetyltransferase [Roseovarius sp. TE539]